MKNINSLKKTKEFKEVYGKGKSVSNSLMVVFVLEKEAPLRIGISASKKVGGSVERHRAVRLIRESFISAKEKLPENLWIVVTAKPNINKKTEKEVEEAFIKAVKRLGIINND